MTSGDQDLEAMEQQQAAARKPHMPVCPHCKMGQAEQKGSPLGMCHQQIGPTVVKIIYCANPECGVIHVVIPFAELPMAGGGLEPSRIVTPGGGI